MLFLFIKGFHPQQLIISCRDPSRLEKFKKLGCDCQYDNENVVLNSRIVFITCSSVHINEISSDIRNTIRHKSIFCSIVGGVTREKIQGLFGGNRILRTNYVYKKFYTRI